jgi:hypothetical protein
MDLGSSGPWCTQKVVAPLHYSTRSFRPEPPIGDPVDVASRAERGRDVELRVIPTASFRPTSSPRGRG